MTDDPQTGQGEATKESAEVVEVQTPSAPAEPAPVAVVETPVEAAPAPAAEAAPEVEPVETKEEIRAGYKVRVAQKIMQGGKERVQNFEGVVIAAAGKTPETKTITVRKISEGIGVEKIFPLAAPTIVSIDILDRMKVRRSKLYFLRESLQKFQKLRRKK